MGDKAMSKPLAANAIRWQLRHALGWALGVAVALPAAAHGETLEEALAQAYANNPALKADEASSRAADEVVAQARAQYGPSVSARGSYGYTENRFVPSRISPQQDGFGFEYSVGVTQPIFTSGRLTAQLKQAKAGQGVSREVLRATRLNLLAAVVGTYVSVLRDEQLVAIAEENVLILRDQFDETQARFDKRFATATDLNQTQNRLSFGQAQLEIARGNLLASRNAYRNLVGHYPGDLTRVPPLPALPESLEAALSIANSENPSLRIARLSEEASRASLALARAERGPDVSVGASVSRAPLSPERDSLRQITTQAQVSVTVPVYTSGLLVARVREAEQRNDADNQLIEQSSRDVREQIASTWDSLSATRRAIPIYQAAVDAAREAVEGVRKQQRAGQATSLDVLDTTRDLLTSRTATAQAEAQLYIQHANLLATLGRLDITDFDQQAPVYDPEAYHETFWAGLPTGPVIQPIDSILYNPGTDHGPVQVEQDSEAGHDMATEPAVTLDEPLPPAPVPPR